MNLRNIKAILCGIMAFAVLLCGIRGTTAELMPSDDEKMRAEEQVIDESMPMKRNIPMGTEADFSYTRVLISLADATEITLALHGAYYLNSTMRSLAGSKETPYTLNITANDGKITVKNGDNVITSSDTVLINRVMLNESGGYATLSGSGGSNDGRSYLGNFFLSVNSNGTIKMVNIIPTAHYLYGIIPYEMSESNDIEALKAQAVASKAYAFGFSYATDSYDITDSFNYQGYRGYKAGYEKCMRACIDVCGEILSNAGEILMTFYGATNGGETDLPSNVFGSSGIDYAYEIRLDDGDFEFTPNKRQTLEIKYGESISNTAFKNLLERELSSQLGTTASVVCVNSARATTPKAEGSKRNLTKLELNLRISADGSTRDVDLTINMSALKQAGVFNKPYKIYWGESVSGGYNVYYCRWGHGLGLSQYGAQAMALEGTSYRSILNFYYRKFKISSVEERNPEEPFSYTKSVLAYGYVNVNTVNMRSGPATSYPVVSKVTKYSHVDIVGEKDGWIICIANGVLGYIRGDYINVNLFPSPTDGSFLYQDGRTNAQCVMRSSPSQYGSEVFTLKSGMNVSVMHRINSWVYVKYRGHYGFVPQQYIDKRMLNDENVIIMPPIRARLREWVEE